jgi:hypothetical protein
VTPDHLLTWALENHELAITLLTLLTGTAGGVRHYRKTGRIPLSTLPWRAFRRLAFAFRRRYFTVKRPRKRGTIIESPGLEEIQTRLGKESFASGWPLSYRYRGEDLNARRYFLAPSRELPHRQLHIRGFELSDGSVELIAHEEPDPIRHPRAHLRESDMADATPWLQGAWESKALDPRTFDRQQTDG